MRIGVPREIKPLEGRVGLIPAACAELVRAGHEVFIETSAGEKSGYLNEEFEKTIIMVTHDAKAAERAHAVMHLDKGVLSR